MSVGGVEGVGEAGVEIARGEKEIQGDKRRNKTKSDRGVGLLSLQCPREFLSSVKKLIGRLSASPPSPPLPLTCSISLAYQTFRENNISPLTRADLQRRRKMIGVLLLWEFFFFSPLPIIIAV